MCNETEQSDSVMMVPSFSTHTHAHRGMIRKQVRTMNLQRTSSLQLTHIYLNPYKNSYGEVMVTAPSMKNRYALTGDNCISLVQRNDYIIT